MGKQDPGVQFRDKQLEEALAQRAPGLSLGQVAKIHLARTFEVYRRELAGLDFSEGEASLICDANNGTIWEAHTLALLWANVADAIRLNGLEEKWGVDGDALVRKLQGLTPGQGAAVVDACERFWARCDEVDVYDVGLVRRTMAGCRS